MELTKRTVAVYENWNIPEEYKQAMLSKLDQLVAEQKTDGELYRTNQWFQAVRLWINQEAAQEWVDAATAEAKKTNTPLTSITILDEPPQ